MLDSVGPDDKKKLDAIVAAGVRQLQEIDDIKGSLKDTVKAVAEELDLKPKDVMTAIRTVYKDDLAAKKESMDAVTSILVATGHG